MATVLVVSRVGNSASVHVEECIRVKNASERVIVARGVNRDMMASDLKARGRVIIQCRCVSRAKDPSMRMGG